MSADRREASKIELARLVHDFTAGRFTDDAGIKERISALAQELDDPGNPTYDPGLADLLRESREVLRKP